MLHVVSKCLSLNKSLSHVRGIEGRNMYYLTLNNLKELNWVPPMNVTNDVWL